MNRSFFTKLPTGLLPMLAAAGMALTMNSCIAENTDDCHIPLEHNVRLRVLTDFEAEGNGVTRAAAGQEWYDDQIESVSVLVFDETGAFVDSWEGGAYTLGSDYFVPMNLPEGHTYRFVVWTNHTCSEYEHSHWDFALDHDPDTGEPRPLTIDDITMDLVMPTDENGAETRTFTEDLPHRHHGSESMAVFDGGTLHDCTVEITPHTHKINFVLRDLPMARQEDEFEITVSDYNTSHKIADASVVTDPRPYYHLRDFAPIPESVGSEAIEQQASMILLQITDSTGEAVTSFEIVDKTTGETIYPTSAEQENELLDIIRAKYGITTHEAMTELLSREYEFTVIFTFGARLSIDIEIGDYEYIENPTPLF